MGATVFGETLTLRCRRRGRPGRFALLALVIAGLTGAVILPDRPAGRARDDRADAPTRPQERVAVTRELSSPPPDEALSSPPPPPPPADPVAPVPAVVPPVPPATSPPSVSPESPEPVPVRAAATRPDPGPWTVSSGPLPASPPVRVDIAAVGATAPIDPLGLNPDGTLEVPVRFSRAGWYTGRPTPGETGPAIIVAHRASRRGPGAFWHLPDVRPGQEIVVTRADGSRVAFVVDRLEQHPKSAFPTEAVYGPTPETALRLITCGGPFEPALGDHYRDNVIVFARMTGWAI